MTASNMLAWIIQNSLELNKCFLITHNDTYQLHSLLFRIVCHWSASFSQLWNWHYKWRVIKSQHSPIPGIYCKCSGVEETLGNQGGLQCSIQFAHVNSLTGAVCNIKIPGYPINSQATRCSQSTTQHWLDLKQMNTQILEGINQTRLPTDHLPTTFLQCSLFTITYGLNLKG